MSRLFRLLPIALALALALSAATASAATVREYQIQFAPTVEQNGAVAIITAVLDPSEAFPAEIRVPVPAGSELLWAGEILGGDPQADPVRETTVERIGEMDVYTLTLEQAYTAQLEIRLPAPTISGSTVSASMNWINPGPEVLVTGAIVVEPRAGNVTTTPDVVGETRTNEIGETLYPLQGVRVPENGAYTMSVEWERNAAGGGTAGPGADSPMLPILIGALVLAIVALVLVLVRERSRARRHAEYAEAE